MISDPDLLFIIGCVIGVMTIPSLLSAFSEGRPPRGGAVTALMAGALIAYAVSLKPTGYAIGDIPQVFQVVVNRYLR